MLKYSYAFKCNEKKYDEIVCIYHCSSVSKKIFWCGCCSLLIFVAKKAAEGSELQFLCTKAVSPSKVEE